MKLIQPSFIVVSEPYIYGSCIDVFPKAVFSWDTRDGDLIILKYQDGSTFRQLTQVVLDPQIPNTFELYLTLQPDNTSWYNKMTKLIK